MKVKHGYTRRFNHHPLYNVWMHMKQRCINKNNHAFKDYGGRGITVCSAWLDSFNAFIKWALNNGWQIGLQIDREDNGGNYTPENCRFVTIKQNSNNKRKYKTTQKFIGISNHRNKFSCDVRINGKTIYVGLFSNPIDAAVARDSYVINKNLGRRLNFPQPIMEIRQ